MPRRRTMREERRTYRRKRCTYREPTGFQCRSRPEQGSDRCLLHVEPEVSPFPPSSTSVTPPS